MAKIYCYAKRSQSNIQLLRPLTIYPFAYVIKVSLVPLDIVLHIIDVLADSIKHYIIYHNYRLINY